MKKLEIENQNVSDSAEGSSSWGADSLNPSTLLSARQKELARLISIGKTNKEIAETLGYSTTWLSRLAHSPKIIKEVERLQDKLFDCTIGERLSEMGSTAASVIEEILTSSDPYIKPQLKAETARWVLEKLTGKPKQEIETKDGNLTDFMTLLKQMKEGQQNHLSLATDEARNAGSSLSTSSYIDISPKEKDPLEIWIDENI